jgi:predicted dehydrogenase
MDKVKVGIIGLGNIAQVTHLPLLSKLPNAEIIGLCDSEFARAKALGERYKVKHVFRDYQDLLALGEMDAVIVATPTNTHKDIALASIKAKKHCLIEKPLARTAKEAKEILDAQTKDVKMMVGMNQRFRPDAMVLKGFIQNQEVGDVFFVKCGWLKKNPVDMQWKAQKNLSGGGVFLDLGIMILDLALWLLNFPAAKSVSALNFERDPKETHLSTNVEDFSSVLIRLKNGQAITIETGWNFEVDSDLLYCNVYGKDGFARMYPLKFHKKLNENLVNVTPEKIGSLEDIYKRSYYNELKHFVDAVAGLYPMTSTIKEAYDRMLIVDAIYKSAKQKKEVQVGGSEKVK